MAKNSSRIYGLWFVVLLSFMAFVRGYTLHATGYMIPSKEILVGRMTILGMSLGSSVGLAFYDGGVGAFVGACLGGVTGLVVGEGIVCLRSIKDGCAGCRPQEIATMATYEGPLECVQMQRIGEAAENCTRCQVQAGRSRSI